MHKFLTNPFVLLASVGALSACGGTTTSYYELLDTTGGTATIAAIAQDSGSPISTTQESGTYDYATAVATLSSTGYTLDASSALSNDQSSTPYSYVSGLTSPSGNYRIVGVVTDAGDLPSDSTVVYNGQAYVTVDDGSLYEGTMNSTVTATIGTVGSATDTVTVALDSITNANVTVGANPSTSYTPSGAEDITFSNLDISGATFAAGSSTTATVDGFGGAAASIDTSTATLTASGFFAGSTGQEVAGGATMSAAGGNALITFTGTQ